jgi:hypothetical protein
MEGRGLGRLRRRRRGRYPLAQQQHRWQRHLARR